MGEREKILRCLESEFTEPVRDPIWKHIYLSPLHEKIISLPVFQELHSIKQLGPAYLVYPGATHTRFAHSLGTFHLAGRLIRFLVQRSPSSPFTLEGVRAFLAAALLHDLGHYPCAHSLKHLGLADHEVLTGRLVRSEPLQSLLPEPERTAAIVDKTMGAGDDRELVLLRGLLSGVLDPDKLDYLNRDAYYCGVPYGVQDVDFFLGEIEADERTGFTISAKGLTAVEHILFSKYLMYKTVYWHKAVRTATAMIRKALLLALRDRALKPDDLYRLTDASLAALPEKSPYPPLGLLNEVFARRLYKRVESVPFDGGHPGHRLLGRAEECLKREAAIAREIGRAAGKETAEWDVIIDLPEDLRFEIDLPVAPSRREKEPAHTIWSGRTPESFTRSLRTVSLMVRRDPDLIAAAEKVCREKDAFHP